MNQNYVINLNRNNFKTFTDFVQVVIYQININKFVVNIIKFYINVKAFTVSAFLY